MELQVLLNDDDSQTLKRFAEQLDVSQQAVSDRMRKIQKTSRWVPHELNDGLMEKRKSSKTHVTFCSLGTKESRFCIV